MKQCVCGCTRFACTHTVTLEENLVVDFGEDEDVEFGDLGAEVSAGDPYGPYVCEDCGQEYISEDDIPEVPAPDEKLVNI